MLGQIRIEFIFAVVIFGLIILFIASQINTMLTITLTTSKSDDLRAKATGVMTVLIEDGGEPEDWDQPQEIPVDVMLIIDRSGSMDDDCPGGQADPGETPCKINDAKTAAKYFVDLMNPDMDKVGLVSFSTSSTLDQGLTFDQTAVKNAIDSLSVGGRTAIGSGINTANNELINNGRVEEVWVEILLSDGKENEGSDPIGNANIANASGIVIYTIGLGPDADEYLLQDIANITGGKYYFAPSGTDLEEIYEEISILIKIDPLRLGLVGQQSYQLNVNKITILNSKCTLLDYFDLRGYRLKIYNKTETGGNMILFCGYDSLVPPTTIITRDVFIDGTPGNISLELWL